MVKTTGAKRSEMRLRMTRIPKGADLILNKVSGDLGDLTNLPVSTSCLRLRLPATFPSRRSMSAFGGKADI
jgi:molybdopterin-biosynthesis enzyme MoeA-like protein